MYLKYFNFFLIKIETYPHCLLEPSWTCPIPTIQATPVLKHCSKPWWTGLGLASENLTTNCRIPKLSLVRSIQPNRIIQSKFLSSGNFNHVNRSQRICVQMLEPHYIYFGNLYNESYKLFFSRFIYLTIIITKRTYHHLLYMPLSISWM